MSESTADVPGQGGEAPPPPTVLNYAQPGTVAGNEHDAMKLVTIATFAQAWEAHLAAGKLESEGIAAVIADENMVGTGGGLYTNMVGGIKLQVPRVDRERALAALPQRVRAVETPCPRCRSTDTRQIDFSPGLKIFFLLLLGLPYLFVQRSWACLDCGYIWRAPSGGAVDRKDEDEDDGDEGDGEPEDGAR